LERKSRKACWTRKKKRAVRVRASKTVNIRTTAKGTQQDSEISLGQQLAAKITTLGNQPYKHL
jgi:hypothetical protein